MTLQTNPNFSEAETRALAACYRLLIQKALERKRQGAGRVATAQADATQPKTNNHLENKL